MARTILLADDSVTIQKIVALMFDDGEFEVAGFTNGDEALAQARKVLPDMVIADVHMPGASGYEVARGVKQLSDKTPVLLLVGTFEPFDEQEYAECGADGYLLKPFEAGELRQRVDALVGAEAPSESGVAAGADLVAEAEPEPDQVELVESGGGDIATTLTPEMIDRIAHRVVELISADAVRAIADDLVPELAEAAIQKRIEELERDVE